MVRIRFGSASRNLRGFVLVVIFAVVLPSLLLSGFGLIAINNERDAALQRVHELYGPLGRKLSSSLSERLRDTAADSAEPLRELEKWGRREMPRPGDAFTRFNLANAFATNYFFFDQKGNVLIPRSEKPVNSWQGYLPPEFQAAQREEFEQKDFAAASKRYQRLLGAYRESDPFRCLILNGIARSLARTGEIADSIQTLSEIEEACATFVDGAGYNLALGASLRILELSDSGSSAAIRAAVRLAARLSDPTLPVLQTQAGFVARRANGSLDQAAVEDARRARNDQGRAAARSVGAERLAARARIAAVANRDALIALVAPLVTLAETETRLVTLREKGGARLLLLRRGAGLSGFEIAPGALGPLLETLLRELDADRRIRPAVRHEADSSADPADPGVLAASVPLEGELADWRLELRLSGTGAIDQLAQSRTQIYVWVLILLVTALAAGVSWLVIGTVREARLARLKTDFVSSVSHELRTPLTSIRMFVDTLLLDRVKDREEARECLQIIGQESERLSRLVERILDFSRMEAGRKAYRFQPEEVATLVRAARDACRLLIEEKGFSVHVALSDDLPEVPVDRDAMVEVLINLLTNAIKYSPIAREVEIGARQVGESVEIEVVDHGIGIPHGELNRIFEKFYRIDTELSAAVPGSGLGLSLVQYIVRAHAGQVRVASAPEKGSTFTVRLPLKREQGA